MKVYGSIPFAPSIDPVSKAMGRKPTLMELVENERGKRIKETVRKKEEDRRDKECSFKPKINRYLDCAYTHIRFA
jgi:hypothetical protein